MTSTVVISARGEARIAAGHVWIYRADLAQVQADGGDLVRVLGPRGRPLGWAFFSDHSQIALRLVSRREAALEDHVWRDRLEAAIRFRDSLAIDGTCYRLVHGESDLIPSLIVDRYGDYLVVQTLSQATDRRLDELTEALVALMRPAGVLVRNDPHVRSLEGLPQETRAVFGEVPETVVVHDRQLTLEVDLWKGQKTGLFLDQRENHDAAAGYAKGRALDCFSYNGGFALKLAPHCREVTALDQSAEALRRLERNAASNGALPIVTRETNVFDELRLMDRQGERFDIVVLDPPAFAKNRASVPKALAGYKEINLRALKLLNPGGYLVTCSCSYNVDEAQFGEVVYEAALDAGVTVTVVEKRMQSRDHPVLLGVPETYYLKCFILRKLG